jgi:hypothetical protein
MRIGNFQYRIGEAIQLNKWLFSIEIGKCPPHMFGIFRPYINLIFIKIIDEGEPYKIDGRPSVQKGGVWRWVCPFGISIEFRKF